MFLPKKILKNISRIVKRRKSCYLDNDKTYQILLLQDFFTFQTSKIEIEILFFSARERSIESESGFLCLSLFLED
jgi:hypothetical protein